MQLAGIPISDEDLFKLAGLLRTQGFEDAADKLTKALFLETKVLALTVVDRESILRGARPSEALRRARTRLRTRPVSAARSFRLRLLRLPAPMLSHPGPLPSRAVSPRSQVGRLSCGHLDGAGHTGSQPPRVGHDASITRVEWDALRPRF
jgi:hypothetical protein